VSLGTGDQSYADSLRERASTRGIADRVLWLAPSDDVVAAYSASNVLVSSSSYGEGHPTVIAEAMACEVPCVVTDSGDSADLVGDTGIVVPTNDVDALTDAVVRVIAMPADAQAEMGRNGRRRACEEFSVRALVDRTVDALSGSRAVGSRTS
jgi:glycosyltransferase involved in cell wall biosynthesis